MQAGPLLVVVLLLGPIANSHACSTSVSFRGKQTAARARLVRRDGRICQIV